MAKILFNDPNNDPNKKNPEDGEKDIVESKGEVVKAESNSQGNIDEFAVFPQWDVVPPNAIINPRIR